MDRLKLEPTSALVMIWSIPLYRDGPVQPFLEGLDLTSGEELLERCNAICPWYGEVIINRKHFIKALTGELLDEGLWGKTGRGYGRGYSQVVILGAGRSPLGLELVMARPDVEVYEVDISGMDEKERLYRDVWPKAGEKLRCLTLDVTSEDLMERLVEKGYRILPTIVLLEGISYYLSREELRGVLSRFSSGENAVVIEYLRPCEEVEEARREIPRGIFSAIREQAGGEMSCYTEGELEELFDEVGKGMVACHSMAEMEKMRCKENRYFPDRDKGWIEVAVGRI